MENNLPVPRSNKGILSELSYLLGGWYVPADLHLVARPTGQIFL